MIPMLGTAIEHITESEAKVALIWILGEFGEHIDDAPYLLESLVGNLKETQESVKVK